MRENEEHLVENVSDSNQNLLQFLKQIIRFIFSKNYWKIFLYWIVKELENKRSDGGDRS